MTGERPFKLWVLAGEPSGDALAAAFVTELRTLLCPRQVIVHGVGEKALQGENGQTVPSLFPMSDIALMGFSAVIKKLPLVLRHMTTAAKTIAADQPDLLLTIDSPDFALRVARKVRRLAPTIPIVHWVCPSVWAWRPGRARRMKPHIDLILALLPFESQAMAELGGPLTVFVGHPLIERIKDLTPSPEEQGAREDTQYPVILVLPGSRGSEIRHHLPLFQDTVEQIARDNPRARFVIPAVPHLRKAVADHVSGWTVQPLVIEGEEEKLQAFRQARAALAASGTVTLELALANVPMVAAYRVSGWEAMIARRLIRVPSVLLPNLIVGDKIVPEYLQEKATAKSLSEALLTLLPDGEVRSRQMQGFARLKQQMMTDGNVPATKAVTTVMDFLKAKTSGR